MLFKYIAGRTSKFIACLHQLLLSSRRQGSRSSEISKNLDKIGLKSWQEQKDTTLCKEKPAKKF